MLALLIVAVYTFGVSYLLYWLTNKMIPMRVSARSECIGLDKSQHDVEYGPEATTELAEDNISVEKWFDAMQQS